MSHSSKRDLEHCLPTSDLNKDMACLMLLRAPVLPAGLYPYLTRHDKKKRLAKEDLSAISGLPIVRHTAVPWGQGFS